MKSAWTFAAICLAGLARLAAAEPAAESPSFELDVRPILKAHCFECHGAGAELEGGLDLRLRRFMAAGGDSGAAIVPKDRNKSLLFERITKGEMPPVDRKLSAKQIDLVGRWIDGGATTARPEPEKLDAGVDITPEERAFWSFQPIRRPAIPDLAGDSRVRTPIDALVLAGLHGEGLDLSPEADRFTFIKRATFDLTGLPPTVADVAEFLADSRPDAYELLIDRLLASPRYGERWGRHWLDAAGYADSDGYVDADTVRPYAYKYRDYVIRAHNADKPWDEFLVEQLAGDELIGKPPVNLSPDELDKLIATGFLRMGPDGTAADGIDNGLVRNQVLIETVKIVSTSLFGLTVGCAQCHDHRYDPIPQADYYRLRAVFEPAYDWKQWRTPPQRLVSLYTDADRAAAAQIETEAGALAAERNKKQEEFLAAALEMELEKRPEPMRAPLRVAQQTPAAQRSPDQQKLLAENPSVNVHPGVLYQYNQAAADELKKFDERIAAVRAKKPVEDFVQVLGETPGQVPQTFRFHRGDFRQPKEAVPPGGLSIASPPGERLSIADKAEGMPTTGRRLSLARWIVGDKNPLTARVLVNRVWMHHFGRGLVATPSDFGALGERPTYPKLLDWLTAEFTSGGWRLKRLHRLIMTSSAYRQSSAVVASAAGRDSENRFGWRMPVRRLDAESIRDRMLSASGMLSARMFGPAVPVKEDDVGQVVVGVDAPAAAAGFPAGHEAFRRSVYVQVRRSRPLAVLQAFDAPVMETNCDRRTSSTVATQSLLMMNSDLALSLSQYFARRVLAEAGSDAAACVARAWQLALLRAPDDAERSRAVEFLSQRLAHYRSLSPPPADAERLALASLCQVLLGSNEFLYVD